jgi:hypothetical protein
LRRIFRTEWSNSGGSPTSKPKRRIHEEDGIASSSAERELLCWPTGQYRSGSRVASGVRPGPGLSDYGGYASSTRPVGAGLPHDGGQDFKTRESVEGAQGRKVGTPG